MILNVCYNNDCAQLLEDIKVLCEKDYPDIVVFSFNESSFQEKKKSYKVKGGYSARMTPFALLTGDNKDYIKAFYSEDGGCTLDKISEFLKNNLYENSCN